LLIGKDKSNENPIFFFKCNSENGASASKFRRIMSAVGTTLLQSPGCNEGKARYETLGTYR